MKTFKQLKEHLTLTEAAKIETIGHLKAHPQVKVNIVHKGKGRRDVEIHSPVARPVKMWTFVPHEHSHKDIADHLEKRDADRFAKAGGVHWHHNDKKE